MSGCRVPWWDQPRGAFVGLSCFSLTFLFVYFDCFVEVKVFAKEFFDVNLVLYKTF